MTAVGESDSSLAAKCLDFCQTLAGQGLAFKFSLSISSTFCFSLDTRKKGQALATNGKTKKKSSPSTFRRNTRRKAAFLQRKRNPTPVSSDVDVDPPAAELPLKCDQCEYVAASEKGLRQHIRMKHKESQPEKMRKPSAESPLAISPIKDQGREEPIDQDGDEPLDVQFCSCANVQCCRCYRDESCDGMHAMSNACHFCLFCQCKGNYVNGRHVHCKLPKPQS